MENYFETHFSHVIYNFPHVGGKMKIHKNRQLLRDFFQSACKIIRMDGFIITTLCSGQAGIPLDNVTRRFEDTWQLVSMATFADLILRAVTQFDALQYPSYTCIGYRSQNKSFHQSGSLMFCFSKAVLQSIRANSLSYEYVNMVDNSYVYVPRYLLSRFHNLYKKGSFANFCISYIVKILDTSFHINIHEKKCCDTQQVIQFLSKTSFQEGMLGIHPLLHLNKEKIEMKAFCGIIGVAKDAKKLQCFLNLKFGLQIHNTSVSWDSNLKTFHFDDVCWYTNLKNCTNNLLDNREPHVIIILDLTLLSCQLFDLQEGEIWCSVQNVISENGVITYQPYSMFPPLYTFHLSFWLPPESVNIGCFYKDIKGIILSALENTVVNISLLSTYTDPKCRKSQTYKIVYCSFDAALSKDKVKHLHSEVGKLLETTLGCEIR